MILIFMDDPTQRSLFTPFAEYDQVLLLEGTTDRSDMTPSGIMNRIMSNTQRAISFALDNDISWLLPVDSDEIFYDAGDRSWQSWDDVGHVTFFNHEAVPMSVEPADCFTECTLFRVNGRTEFMAYGNGKSAVRVNTRVTAGIHGFGGYEGEHRAVAHPAILHYPNPSFDSWVAKFANYSDFSDFWWDDPNAPVELKFMLRSRDLLRAARENDDWVDARAYFDSWILDAETREQLLQAEVLRHYDPMAELLQRS
jgi:hypothetical protein